MGLFTKIKRHAAVAQGNFAQMFGDARIAPLPEAISRILAEIHKDEPNITVLETLIASEPELSIQILSTVNSSLYALRHQVTSIRHAMALLGLDQIRAVILAGAMQKALPSPKNSIFQQEVYWTDTLLRSLLARELTRLHRPGDEEQAFTAMLVSDVAIPVLLDSWAEYYEPVVEQWQQKSLGLSTLEKQSFGWDHGAAGSWVLQYWGFPMELVCLVAAHHLPPSKIRELELDDTVATDILVAGRLCSCWQPDLPRCLGMIDMAEELLGISPDRWPDIMAIVADHYAAIHHQFGLQRSLGDKVFAVMNQIFVTDRQPT